MKTPEIVGDYLPFLIFPIILVILFYALPMELQNRFAFNPQNPSWFTLFTASFFHNSLEHLTNNIVAYLIGSFVLFLAFRSQSRTKNLFFLILTCVLIVPFISSITVYFLTPTIPPSRGFSDIVFSVVGLFPAATLIFMKSRSGFVYAIGWLLLVIIAYFFFTSQLTDAVVLFVIYALLFSLWGLKMKFFNKELFAKQVGILYVLIISPVILLLLGFPVILTVNGSLVNVMVHYTGLQFGILVGFFYLYRDYFNRVFSSITSLFKSKKWTE